MTFTARATGFVLLLAGVLSSQTLVREYIHFNGRPIAIEEPMGNQTPTADSVTPAGGGGTTTINVVVTDSRDSLVPGGAQMAGGYSLVRVNAGTSDRGTLSHELAHHFTGDTRMTGLAGALNVFADVNNDMGRAILRNWNTPAVRALRIVDPFLNLHRQDAHDNARRWYGQPRR